MLFSDHPRRSYRSTPIHEVICQLRFPTILNINHVEPADFQEAIRQEFPQYFRRQTPTPPQITGLDTPNPRVEQQPPVTNYYFLSADGHWKLNLTRDFIALSTRLYPGWEAFARQLDKPLAGFIRIYQPSYFQRLGLRYVNILSRSKLGVEDVPWTDLIAPAYTGPLLESDVTDDRFLNYDCNLALKLDSSCQAKVHTGLGRLKKAAPNAPQDPEMKFIFDMDLSMGGSISCTLAAAGLETLHGHAGRIFEGAIKDRLREAMDLT